jgi:hypothetical protein
MAADHTHDAGDEDQAAAWFRGLDIVVWFAVAVIVILAAEWLGGYLVRERLARSFRRYLDQLDELRRN